MTANLLHPAIYWLNNIVKGRMVFIKFFNMWAPGFNQAKQFQIVFADALALYISQMQV